jgi:hypothetical protein
VRARRRASRCSAFLPSIWPEAVSSTLRSARAFLAVCSASMQSKRA